jgi:hypothetical protein
MQTDEIDFLFTATRFPIIDKVIYGNTYLCGTILANIMDEHCNVQTD